MLDKLLNGLFTFGIPLIVILWGLFCVILAILCLPAENSWFIKMEAVGFAFVNICCCWWFFHWRAEIIASSAGNEPVVIPGLTYFESTYDFVPPLIALLPATLVLGGTYFLRKVFRIPYSIFAIIYIGILIFGL